MSADTVGQYRVNTMVELTRIACINCGTQFAMSTQLRERRMKDHQYFWCPNGHEQYYSGKTEEEKLREELERSRDSLARVRNDLATAEASRRAYKGEATKLRNRAKAGVCAFCQRQFKNYAAHMKTKHADS